MLFYHNSNVLLEKLIPTIGKSRHNGEDPRAVGKAVVWLSNLPQVDEQPSKYRYVVEIDENSSLLFMDEPFNRLQINFNALFPNNNNNWRWYFYLDELEILERYDYDDQQKEYIKK